MSFKLHLKYFIRFKEQHSENTSELLKYVRTTEIDQPVWTGGSYFDEY
jgi:hypothetical protein